MEREVQAGAGPERALHGGELARAYVPVQVYTGRLDPVEGWREGSIFPELIRPYRPESRRPRRGR